MRVDDASCVQEERSTGWRLIAVVPDAGSWSLSAETDAEGARTPPPGTEHAITRSCKKNAVYSQSDSVGHTP